MRLLGKDRVWRKSGITCLLAGTGIFLACGADRGMPSAPESDSPTARQLTQMSIAYTPTDRHVFLTNGSQGVPAGFQTSVEAKGGKVLRVHDEIGMAVTTGLTDAAAAALAKGVGQVERDLLVQWLPSPEELQATVHSEAASGPGTDSHKPPATAVFFAPYQWNMRIIHAPQAWATGREGSPNVRVAILDTGLDLYHQDQAGLIDVASSIAFAPSTQGPPDWEDDHFHGTHVGGIVTTNNIGTAGVVSHVTLIAIKVLNASGSGTFADVIAGIIHAADVEADVANLSLGDTFEKAGEGPLVAALNKAVNYANRHDVLVVSAAGNDAEDLQHNGNRIAVPCESGTGICISATDEYDDPSSYTNYGSNVIDLAAPGGDFDFAPQTNFVLSPCSTRNTTPGLEVCRTSPTWYVWAAGTSMAAPHVSGLAAYLDSQYGGELPPSQLETSMQQHADDLGKNGKDEFYGHGRINVFRTLSGTPTP